MDSHIFAISIILFLSCAAGLPKVLGQDLTPTVTPSPTPLPTPYTGVGPVPFVGNIDVIWYFLLAGIAIFCLFYIGKKIRT